jgi:predicted transcriptional regulator
MRKGIILLLIFATTSVFGGSGKKTIKPVNAEEKTRIEILGRTYNYYALKNKDFLTLDVRGPAKIKVYTRAMLSKNEKNATYSISYFIDGKKTGKKKFKSVPASKKAHFVDMPNFVPAENRNLTIELGEGFHTVRFKLNDALPPVFAKFHLFKKTRKKKKWAAMQPLEPVEHVYLIADEELVEYFGFGKGRPLRLTVIGPTQLRILTRTEITNTNKKRVSYRLQIFERENLINSFQLYSVRSYSTRFEKIPNAIPSKAREIVVNVPEGLHTYVIKTPDENVKLYARFFIPTEDIDLGLNK